MLVPLCRAPFHLDVLVRPRRALIKKMKLQTRSLQVIAALCLVVFAIGTVPFIKGPKKFVLKRTEAAILFREVADKPIERWIPFLGDEVPGYDHIALLIDGIVYETHPGYGMGFYLGSNGQDSIFVDYQSGIQWQHTLNSFAYNSREISNTQVTDFIAIPIDPRLAAKMHCAILSVSDRPYTFLNYTIESLLSSLSPAAQKGGQGNFTCVGLV